MEHVFFGTGQYNGGACWGELHHANRAGTTTIDDLLIGRVYRLWHSHILPSLVTITAANKDNGSDHNHGAQQQHNSIEDKFNILQKPVDDRTNQ